MTSKVCARRPGPLRTLVAGWVGAFIGNGFLGAMFSAAPVRALLYDPAVQSATFIALTPTRDIPVSVAGLVVLGGLHGLFYGVLRAAVPGRGWLGKGLAWGFGIWATYWLAQEWFIYVTLLGEPLRLAALELAILLAGSLVEGVVVAGIVERGAGPPG